MNRCIFGIFSRRQSRQYLIAAVCLVVFLFGGHEAGRVETARGEEVRFDINVYELDGNAIFDDGVLLPLLEPYTGPGKGIDDVEQARARLEKYYHENGYPTVLVNTPPQNVTGGIVILDVIEATIRRVRVTGNRYYTKEKVLTLTPSLKPGTVLYLPDLQGDLVRLNRHPDLKVKPTLSPGKVPGTIDVDLQVKDKLPLHGSLELNNRNTHTTTDLRLNALLKYDNLWQRDHSATIQFQTSPEDTSEVQAYAGSYVMSPFWSDDHVLAIYGIYSNSETAFGEGFQTTGKGFIVGMRNVMPLGGSERFYHSLTLGIDYKDFDEYLGFDESSSEDIETPIAYVPLSLNYSNIISDHYGRTDLGLGLNLLLRGLVTDLEQFESKRYQTRANYVYATADVKRIQKLGAGWQAIVQLEGQLSDQPLVSNEQFYAGGMFSVNGYKESEAGGDNAVRGRLEVATPDLWDAVSDWKKMDLQLHGYYDIARLWTIDALPSEEESLDLEGVGAALTGAVGDRWRLEWAVQWGKALKETATTEADDQLVYFFVKGKF